MRAFTVALLALPFVACGDSSSTSNTAADSSTSPSSSSTGPEPTVTGGPDATGSSGDTGGSASMTASGTTTSSTSSPTTTDVMNTGTGDDTTDTTATTSPVSDTAMSTSTSGTTAGDDTTGPVDTSVGESSEAGGTTVDPVEPCACPDLEVPLDDGIFVLSITAELWKFFPADNSFVKLGNLTCNLPPATFSMAVDRQGFAWVQYSGGELRKIDVTNVASCTDPGYVVGQMGITNFGMAFVSNSQFDACDRIYGNRGNGLPEGNAISDFF